MIGDRPGPLRPRRTPGHLPEDSEAALDDIRNFCIIAHIDHGKSTLADRLIQRCGAVEDRDFRDQILDSMDLERERGITIKATPSRLPYTARDGKTYELNLIDTPGHVDFSHEVRRSLMSCEGALLVVDASQGVEAQTVANLYLAMEFGLEVVPVINKIDLPSADVERVMEEIDRDLGLDPFESVQVSAKMGTGIDDLLEAIVTQLPPPKGDPQAPLRALLFDAQYDAYRGAVLLVRLFDGTLKAGTRVRLMHSGSRAQGRGGRQPAPQAGAGARAVGGRGGLRARGHEEPRGPRHRRHPHRGRAARRGAGARLPEAKPVVFSSIYPMATDDYEDLTKALEKLKLNDASLIYEKDGSAALGFGFRCGFLGLLHLDVVQERLEREYDLSLILSAPSVRYRIVLNNDTRGLGRQPDLLSRPGADQGGRTSRTSRPRS